MRRSRRRAAQARAAAEGRPLCALCRRHVPVGADGRCLLGHRVRQPDAAVPEPAVAGATAARFEPVDAGAPPDDTVAVSWADELRSLGDAGLPVLLGAAAPAHAPAEGSLSSWEASAASWDGPEPGSQPASDSAGALDELLACSHPAGAPPSVDGGLATALHRGPDAGAAPAAPGDTPGEVTRPFEAIATGSHTEYSTPGSPGADGRPARMTAGARRPHTGSPSADDGASMSYAAFAAGAGGANARDLNGSPIVTDTPAAVAAQVKAQARRRTLRLGVASIAVGGLLGTVGAAVLL